MKKSSSKFISYPFAFDYTDKDSVSHQYDQGGIFTLRPDLLPSENATNYFKYLNETTNVVLGKSKALYDINVAIFKLEDEIEGHKIDLFYDSDNYCSFFVNYIGKVHSCLYGKNEFITYRNKTTNKGVVALFNHTGLLNNSLFNDNGSNAFGLLIIHDIVYGSENLILLRGGLLVSGKSGLLLEKFGILKEGSYDTTRFLLS